MITTIRHPIRSLLFPSLRAPVVLGALSSRDLDYYHSGIKPRQHRPREEDLPVISLRPSLPSFLIKLVDIFHGK